MIHLPVEPQTERLRLKRQAHALSLRAQGLRPARRRAGNLFRAQVKNMDSMFVSANTTKSRVATGVALAIALCPVCAYAQPSGDMTTTDAAAGMPPAVDPAAGSNAASIPAVAQPAADTTTPGAAGETHSPTDPTGGAYTTPTLLFIPAGAVPKWNVRAIASTELQSPSDVNAGVRPGLGVELGLPAGFTLGAGSNWVGGDVSATGKTDFNLGISPYVQGRYHILGDVDGRGWQLGTSLTYKFVGFEGDPGELELAASLQYRRLQYEFGVQAVFGQDFEDAGDHDGEFHAYAVARPIPELALGAAGQVRVSLADDSDGSKYDVIGGGIASLSLGKYQIGALAGASTLGLAQGHVGGLGQLFATARF